MLFGVLNVFKPAEFTSRDVVNIVQRACPRKTKVGHAGTLDPMATGVLVVATGPATKLIQYAQNSKKSYVGAFRLGLQSDTEDVTGDVKELPDAPVITESQLRDSLPEFIGTVSQIPPQYSAVKVNGQRAYKAARRGELVEIKARPTTIYSIDLLSFEYPDFAIEIQCGKGTYVRTLGRDIAKRLGSDAIMTKLKRTSIGHFSIDSALSLESINRDNIDSLIADPILMAGSLQRVTLVDEDIERLRHGKRLRFGTHKKINGDEVIATNHEGQILAVLERKGESEYGSKINFVPQLF